MNLPGGWELVLIVLVIMVLFGAKRMPDAARSLGRSMRILKAETKGLRDDDEPGSTTTVHDTAYPPAAVAPPAPITPPTVQPPVAAPPTVTPPAAAEQSPQRPQ
jgi:sec-independent protein translocase protein TatA